MPQKLKEVKVYRHGYFLFYEFSHQKYLWFLHQSSDSKLAKSLSSFFDYSNAIAGLFHQLCCFTYSKYSSNYWYNCYLSCSFFFKFSGKQSNFQRCKKINKNLTWGGIFSLSLFCLSLPLSISFHSLFLLSVFCLSSLTTRLSFYLTLFLSLSTTEFLKSIEFNNR